MTYCLSIKVKAGIVGIADTRITSGTATTRARKVFVLNRNHHSLFIMTSGLRSVRDKAITYFKEVIEEKDEHFDKLYKAVNAFALQVKRVAQEDKSSLKEAGLNFNLHAIVGGQLENDEEHKVYLLYPQGNWIELGESSPFFIIGNSGYGSPILDRTLHYESSMEFALKTGFLSFDATRLSANDVEFPIDVVIYKKDTFEIIEKRFEKEELLFISKLWNEKMKESIDKLPEDWMEKVFMNINTNGIKR